MLSVVSTPPKITFDWMSDEIRITWFYRSITRGRHSTYYYLIFVFSRTFLAFLHIFWDPATVAGLRPYLNIHPLYTHQPQANSTIAPENFWLWLPTPVKRVFLNSLHYKHSFPCVSIWNHRNWSKATHSYSCTRVLVDQVLRLPWVMRISLLLSVWSGIVGSWEPWNVTFSVSTNKPTIYFLPKKTYP